MQNLKYNSILLTAFIGKYFLKQRIIVIEFPMLGEMPFLAPVIRELRQQNDNIRLLIASVGDPEKFSAYVKRFPEYGAVLEDIPIVPKDLLAPYTGLIDVYATSEQYCYGLPGVCSVCFFHGQPSKGVTFSLDVLDAFDYFFLMGDLQLQTLVTFLRKKRNEIEYIPKTVKVGYPKMDALVKGAYGRTDILVGLGMDPKLKTVLYAPAFNEGASLRTLGMELIQSLISLPNVNILIKLAPDMFEGTDNIYATGGINWFEKLKHIESDKLRVVTGLDSNPYVAAADVLVTDVSSIAFDFLYLDKPVIYYDCPEFYTSYVEQKAPHFSFKEFLFDDTINAGRNYGKAVQNLLDLKTAVVDALEYPWILSAKRHEIISQLLYNPGTGAERVVKELCTLAQDPARQNHRRLIHQTNLCTNFEELSPRQICVLLEVYFSHYRIDIQLSEFYAKISKSYIAHQGISAPHAVPGFEQAEQARPEVAIRGYIDAKTTIAAARNANLSVCDYREGLESDCRKKGRRDRIISAMEAYGVLGEGITVCEIGAGTGMYLEKIIRHCRPVCYEVYETALDWVAFLGETYGPSTDLKLYMADGYTMKFSADNSCNLVHAHAVFVYLPMLQVIDYLNECARVCAPGGYIVFDCFLADTFSYDDVKSWQATEWRFPVVIPRSIITEWATENSLALHGEFREIYGESHVEYSIFRKSLY